MQLSLVVQKSGCVFVSVCCGNVCKLLLAAWRTLPMRCEHSVLDDRPGVPITLSVGRPDPKRDPRSAVGPAQRRLDESGQSHTTSRDLRGRINTLQSPCLLPGALLTVGRMAATFRSSYSKCKPAT
ncbi:hypothetical protein CB1_000294021 [Camelus ferus]|nr:hypothetical protein CB1_000294021 [Camelus ferus]